MPLFTQKLDLTTAAKNAGTELADVTHIKGAFKVYDTFQALLSESVSRISDDQIVFVSSDSNLYQATVHPPDYVNTYAPSASWLEFNAFAGDIKGVTAGSGLTGGGSTGTVGIALDTGSAHFTTAVTNLSTSGIFTATGSLYSTTNDLVVTGSLELHYNGTTTPLSITSASTEVFKVNPNGVMVLISQSSIPEPVSGGIYFGNDGHFYFGV